MNREILFRGREEITGEWRYGFYAHLPSAGGSAHIIFEPAENPDESNQTRFVDPSTVGQYTGLKDRNGKRIFEGDIVKYTFDSPEDPFATDYDLVPRVGRVFWSEWRASFAVMAGRNGSSALNNDVARYVRGRSIYEYVRGANTAEAIGNIYDNPELLGGAE